MKKLLCILVVIAVILVGITTVKNDNSIIIYSSMEQFRNDELQEQLNEQFPELDVYVMYMSTAKAATKIRVEGSDSDADIVVGLDQAYMTMIEDHMADVTQYSHLEYEDDMVVENGKYLIWEAPTAVCLPEDSVDKRSLVHYILWDHKESDTTEQLTLTFLI